MVKYSQLLLRLFQALSGEENPEILSIFPSFDSEKDKGAYGWESELSRLLLSGDEEIERVTGGNGFVEEAIDTIEQSKKKNVFVAHSLSLIHI